MQLRFRSIYCDRSSVAVCRPPRTTRECESIATPRRRSDCAKKAKTLQLVSHEKALRIFIFFCASRSEVVDLKTILLANFPRSRAVSDRRRAVN